MFARDTILTEYTSDLTGFNKGARSYDQTLARQARLTDQRLTEMDRRWERSSRSILNMRTSLVGLTGALGVVQVRNYAEAWRSVERQLTSINANSEENQQALIELSLRTRSAVGATSSAVQKLSRSTGDDLDTTIRRVETLQKLLAFGGASNAEQSSVSLQLGQALQSGVLSGDEFRTLREAAPVEFLDALSSAAGVARSELKQVAEDQKLTSDIVLQALDSMAETADKSFRSIALSGDEAVATLSSGLTAYVGRLDETLGATASFNGFLASLGEYLATSAEGAENLAEAIKLVGTVSLVAAGSRGIAATTSALRASAAARAADVAAAQRQLASSQAERRSRAIALDNASARVRLLNQERQARIAADKSVIRLNQQLTKAEAAQQKATVALAGATQRRTVAVNALAAAQGRLSVASRVTAATMRSLNAVMAFFGGPVGLALTALAAGLAVMATRTSEVERLTEGVTERVYDLQSAYASTGGQVDELRKNMASASLADAITQARELDRLLDKAQRRASQQIESPVFDNLLNRRFPEFGKLVDDLISGRKTASEFRRELNELVSQSGDALAGVQQVFEPILAPLLEVAGGAEKANDVLMVLRGTAEEAAAAMVNLGLNSETASQGVDQISSSASAASAGIAGLIKQIPELQKAAQVQANLAQAAKDRDAALNGLNNQGLSGTERIEEERRILDIYARATAEIDGTAEATRDADKALNDYLDQSKVSALDARGQALERERQRYQKIVEGLKDAKAGEDALAAASAAHAANRSAIERRFQKSGSAGVSKETKADLRNLAQLREVLIESGYRELYVEQALNAERARMADLMPTLIEMGLDRAAAEELVSDQLERVKEQLGEVRTASQRASEAFAKGALEDIRASENLSDALGKISDRLLDLAYDQAFDLLADQFARLSGLAGGGGGGLLSNILGAVVSSFSGSPQLAGARAFGGGVRRGSAYLVNENTPRSEVFVAPQNGAVLNVQQAQAALRDTRQAAAAVMVREGDVQVKIINSSSNARVEAQPAPDGRGVNIAILDAVESGILSGRFDQANRQSYGLRRQGRGS